jgi:hypothetical protein
MSWPGFLTSPSKVTLRSPSSRAAHPPAQGGLGTTTQGREELRTVLAFLREGVEITRTIDEMALSTEEPEKWVGLQPEHFAYEVTDPHFWRSQSAVLKADKDLKHYVFITGWTCLDVISRHPPTFSIVSERKDGGAIP